MTTIVFGLAANTCCASVICAGSTAISWRSIASRPSLGESHCSQAALSEQYGWLPRARMTRLAAVAVDTSASVLVSSAVVTVTLGLSANFARMPSVIVTL